MKVMRIGILFVAASAVYAASVSTTFTFDSQTIGSTNITGVAANATPAQIASYMNQVLSASGCAGCSVSVSSGTYADQNYSGEGYAVGPGTGATSLTLGNTNGATASNSNSTINSTKDTFLANTSDSSAQTSDRVYLTFSGFSINGAVSFDYEIFPNGTCPSLPCSSVPDLTFEAGNNTNGTDTTITSFTGVAPGTSPIGSTKSPSDSTANAPQLIGTWSGTLSNVKELDFVDWPATIGVDNLQISWTTQSPVPEPYALPLLGTVVAGLLMKRKFRKASPKSAS